jgi:hypothetical protein
MEFIEAPAFTRHLSKYLDDDQYRTLQAELATNLGDLMPGTGGFRDALGGRPAGLRCSHANCGLTNERQKSGNKGALNRTLRQLLWFSSVRKYPDTLARPEEVAAG